MTLAINPIDVSGPCPLLATFAPPVKHVYNSAYSQVYETSVDELCAVAIVSLLISASPIRLMRTSSNSLLIYFNSIL